MNPSPHHDRSRPHSEPAPVDRSGNGGGSAYTDYDEAHRHYDQTRLALGAKQVLAHLSALSAPAELHVFEGGCGTGLYTEVLLRAGVGRIVAFDTSEEALAQTRLKAEGHPALVTAQQSIAKLPLSDAAFDAACYFFVLHHLDSRADAARGDYRSLRQALREASRVVRDDGLVVIGTCDRAQLAPEGGAMWYYRYFPELAARLQQRFMPVDQLCEALVGLGLNGIDVERTLEVVSTARSFDPNGPFDPAWRAGDSIFSLDDPDGRFLHAGLLRLERALETGEVHQHIAETKAALDTVKQAVLIFARKDRGIK